MLMLMSYNAKLSGITILHHIRVCIQTNNRITYQYRAPASDGIVKFTLPIMDA